MSLPPIGPRVSSDTPVHAPNANASPQHADGNDDAPPAFGSVLTLLLAHVDHGSSEAKPPRAANHAAESESSEPAADGSTTQSEPAPGLLTAPLSGQQHGSAVASLVANPHAIASANEHSAIASFAALEAAADDGIESAMPRSPDPMTNVTVAIAIPAVTVAPEAAHAATATRRSLDLVVPDFRERLDRVIERMESEFGYKVEVTETYRSQARQDALYAQGRSEAGQVVTWTRASNHTAGRAADLVVDGSYDNPLAYQHLMRIAREEGLRTLGPRDPGHVELPASNAVIARPAPSVASSSSIAPSVSKLESPLESSANRGGPNAGDGVARVAAVAAVAAVPVVATVAQVAQVAQVAVGGQATPAVHNASPRSRHGDSTASRARGAAASAALKTSAAGSTPAAHRAATSSPVASMASGEASTDQDTSRDAKGESGERTRLGTAARESAADVLRQTRDELLRAVVTADPNAATQSATSADAPSTIGHTDMSERIARLLKVQDAAGDRPLSQVVLRLERPDGGEDRLRVDLRGSTVSATLDVADQAAADSLGANVKELQRALERHGFEADALTVRSSRAMESSTLARAAGAAAEADLQRATASSPNTSSNTSSRERGARHDEERPSPDSQRHRSRREQKGDR